MLVLFFSAAWSNACNRINNSVAELAAANPGVVFMTLKADAEELKDILNLYNVKELPYFVFLRLKPKSEEEEEVKVEDEMRRENRNRCVLIFRGADIISKFSGESRGKIGRVLVTTFKNQTKFKSRM